MKFAARAFFGLVLFLTSCVIQAQTNPVFYGTVQFRNSSFAGSTARFPTTMLGSGVPSSVMVLFGDGVWRSLGSSRFTAILGTPNEITSVVVGTQVTLSLPSSLVLTGKTITGGTFINGSGAFTTLSATQSLAGIYTLQLRNLSASGAASTHFQIGNDVSSQQGQIFVNSSTSGALGGANALVLSTDTTAPIVLAPNNTIIASFTSTGLTTSGMVTLTAASGLIQFTGASLGQISSTGDLYLNPAAGKNLYLGDGNKVAINSTGLTAAVGITTTVANNVLTLRSSAGNTTNKLSFGTTGEYSLINYDDVTGYLTIGQPAGRSYGTYITTNGAVIAAFSGSGLAVTGALSATGNVITSKAIPQIIASDTGTAQALFNASTNGGAVAMKAGVESAGGGAIFTGSTGYAAVFGSSSGNVQIAANNSVVGTFTSTGLNATDIGQTVAGKGTFTEMKANTAIYLGTGGPGYSVDLATPASSVRIFDTGLGGGALVFEGRSSALGAGNAAIGASGKLLMNAESTDVGLFSATGLAITGALSTTGFFTHGGMKRMALDVVVAASTTLTDLTGLSVALAAGKTYSFRASILTTHSGTGGYKVDLHASGGLTATDIKARVKGFFGTVSSTSNGALISALSALDSGGASMSVTGGGNGEIEVSGTVTVNAGGTLTIQGAQQSAASSSTYQRGSFLEILQY